MKAKKIGLVILITLIIGGFFLNKLYNKPHININNVKADITLTANKIFTDFSSDEILANKLYLDQIIQVKGTVSKIELENNKGIVTLQTKDDFGSVLCYLADNFSINIKDVKIGQELSLKGICTGFLMDVVLVKCIIIN
tara:strand:+ start:11930 stop:12346 length:417 start_codon:yes stop_codon:yes gene_type:complete